MHNITNRDKVVLATHIAVIQKQAAASDHSENCDKKLAEESTKLNEGGSPASPGSNGANAATFETPAHTTKPSSSGPSNKVPDNEDTVPRQKVASIDLSTILDKLATTQVGATKSVTLEAESKKELVGGGNGNEVQSAQESDKAPDIKVSSSQGGGDSNTNTVPRTNAMNKSASDNVTGIFGVLKKARDLSA